MDFIEISRVVLGIFILIFIISNYSKLKERKNSQIIVVAFIFLFLGWIFDLIDDLYYSLLNFIQHTALTVSFIVLAVWYWREFHGNEESEHDRNN